MMKEIASILLPLMLQGTVLGVFVLAVQAAFRKRLPPSWNLAMWALVFLKFLIPIRIESVFSAFGLLTRNPGVWQATMRGVPALAPSAAPLSPALGSALPQATPALQDLSRLADGANVPAALPSIDWVLWLSCAWIIGAVLLALLYIRQYYMLTIDIYKNRSTFADDRIDAIARSCFEAAGISPHTEVVYSSHAKSPFVFGLGKALIAIPGHLIDHMSDDDLRAVLLHEATHIRRNHHRLRFALSLLTFAYWWNPLVWVFSHRVNREMEFDCDRQTLSRGDAIGRKAYADALVRLAGLQGRGGMLTLSFGESHFKGRIRAILENRTFSRTVSIVAIAMIVVTGVAFFTMPKRDATVGGDDPKRAQGQVGATEPSGTTPVPDRDDGAYGGNDNAAAPPTPVPTKDARDTHLYDDGTGTSNRSTPVPAPSDFDTFAGMFGGFGQRIGDFVDWIVENADTSSTTPASGKTLNGEASKVLETSSWFYENIASTAARTDVQEAPLRDGDTLRIEAAGVRLRFERYDGDTLRVEFAVPSDGIADVYDFAVASEGSQRIVRAVPKVKPTITDQKRLPTPYMQPKAVRVMIPKRVTSLRVVELDTFAVVSSIQGLQAQSIRLDDEHGRLALDQNEARELFLKASMDTLDIRHGVAERIGILGGMSNLTLQAASATTVEIDSSMVNANMTFDRVTNLAVSDSMSHMTLTLGAIAGDSSIDTSMGTIDLVLPTLRQGLTVHTKWSMGSIEVPHAWRALAKKADEEDGQREYVRGDGAPTLTVSTSMGNITIQE